MKLFKLILAYSLLGSLLVCTISVVLGLIYAALGWIGIAGLIIIAIVAYATVWAVTTIDDKHSDSKVEP